MKTAFRPSRSFVAMTLYGMVIVAALAFFGGLESLWAFSLHPAHRHTSLALLRGSLAYPRDLAAGLPFVDLQIFNGSLYTNWGYGVPLLQAPFHAFTQVTGIGVQGYFPDRLIFFVYLSVTLLFLFRSLLRFGVLLSSSLTFTVMAFGTLWLIAGRFHVYEETLAYFALAQVAALTAFIEYLHRPSLRWSALLGIFAGLGLLIRPTGAPYLLLWVAILYGSHRQIRDAGFFSLVLSPFVSFWMYSNFIRTGEALSFGHRNATPGVDSELLARFYPPCAATWEGIYEMFVQTGALLFTHERKLPPILESCGFTLQGAEAAPFLSPGLLPLLIICLAYHLRKRAKDWMPWAPVITMGAVWGIFGLGAVAFCDRYAGDFWPALWVFFALFLYQYAYYFPASYTHSPEGIAKPPKPDTQYSSRLLCGEGSTYGWDRDCKVGRVTNFFLFVPAAKDTELFLETDSANHRAEQVYINGKIYRPQGSSIPFSIDRARLASPVVQVTLLWPENGVRLLRAEITER